MNRRKFLSMLGTGVAVTQVAPLLKFLPERASYRTYVIGKDSFIESDRDYYIRKRNEAGPGGWVSYRVKMTVTLRPNSSMRIRYIA